MGILSEEVDLFGLPLAEESNHLDEIAPGKVAPKLSTEDDDSGFVITAKVGKKEAGSISVYSESNDEECYFFSPYEDQPWHSEVCDNEEVVDIRHLSVEEEFRGQGIARALMKEAMEEIQNRWSGIPIFINASPMSPSMSLGDLVKFYTSYGFKVLATYPAHKNAALWKEA